MRRKPCERCVSETEGVREGKEEEVCRSLRDLVDTIKTTPEYVRVCFEFNPGKLAKKMLNAWAELFIGLGVKVELLQTAFM